MIQYVECEHKCGAKGGLETVVRRQSKAEEINPLRGLGTGKMSIRFNGKLEERRNRRHRCLQIEAPEGEVDWTGNTLIFNNSVTAVER